MQRLQRRCLPPCRRTAGIGPRTNGQQMRSSLQSTRVMHSGSRDSGSGSGSSRRGMRQGGRRSCDVEVCAHVPALTALPHPQSPRLLDWVVDQPPGQACPWHDLFLSRVFAGLETAVSHCSLWVLVRALAHLFYVITHCSSLACQATGLRGKGRSVPGPGWQRSQLLSAVHLQLIELCCAWHASSSVAYACSKVLFHAVTGFWSSPMFPTWRACVFEVAASSGCAASCPSNSHQTSGSTFSIAAASTMKETTGTDVGQREQQDAGPLSDSIHAADNAFETENSRFFVADESVRRTATW